MSSKIKYVLKRISIWLVLLTLLSPILVTTFFYFHLTTDFHSEVEYYKGMFGSKPKDLKITTEDGLKLSGWYIEGEADKEVVILLHGIGASRMQMVDQARFLNENGYTVILFDFRNHGLSQGNRTTYGWRERWDVFAVANFVKEIHPNRKFILWGLSMGAATALLAAPDTEGLAGVIAESPFDSMVNTFYHHNDLYFHVPDYPFIPLILEVIGFFGDFDVNKVSPIEAVKRSSNIPTLFVAGKQDRRMVPELVKHIADQHHGKHYYFLGEGSHAVIFQTSGQPYKRAVIRFLEEIEK